MRKLIEQSLWNGILLSRGATSDAVRKYHEFGQIGSLASLPRKCESPPAMTHTHERRRRSRHKTNIPIYVRHSSPQDGSLEEALHTVNVCRDGVYFFTTETLYEQGMRLFVTFPYSTTPGAINRDYIAVVKRVDPLENRYYGIAVKLLGTLALDRM